jgi:hypothetical protein
MASILIVSLVALMALAQGADEIIKKETPQAEAKASMTAMGNAEKAVQAKLAEYARPQDPELLVEARALISPLNSSLKIGKTLPEFDERWLRLQLKVLMVFQNARDKGYDRNAPENAVYMNVAPRDFNGRCCYDSGIDPKSIKDPIVRKKYEEAIAENNRRNDKLRREHRLVRGMDESVLWIWMYLSQLPAGSEARTKAKQIVDATVTDKGIVDRLESQEMPHSTNW